MGLAGEAEECRPGRLALKALVRSPPRCSRRRYWTCGQPGAEVEPETFPMRQTERFCSSALKAFTRTSSGPACPSYTHRCGRGRAPADLADPKALGLAHGGHRVPDVV